MIADDVKKQTGSASSIGLLQSLFIAGFSALPLIIMLLSTPSEGTFSGNQIMLRQMWIPSMLWEVIFIYLAVKADFSIAKELAALPNLARWMLVIWLGFVLFTPAIAGEKGLAIWSSFCWILHAIFGLSALHFARTLNRDNGSIWQMRFALWFGFGALAVAIYVVGFIYLAGLNSKYDWVRSLPGFTHIRHFGYISLPAMALAAGALLNARARNRWIFAALFAVNLAFTIWMGSRAPLLAFGGGALLLLALIKPARNRRFVIHLVLAAFAGVVLSQLVPSPQTNVFNALARFERQSHGDAEEVSSGRTEIWKQTGEFVLAKPISGYGSQQFRELVPAAVNTYRHPHNAILQFLFDWGLIGGGAALLLLGILFGKAMRNARDIGAQSAPFLLAGTSMLCFAMLDGILFYNLTIMLTLLFLAGLVTAQSNEDA
jgi:O-antigen ligase